MTTQNQKLLWEVCKVNEKNGATRRSSPLASVILDGVCEHSFSDPVMISIQNVVKALA